MMWCFLIRSRDQGRIQARILQTVEHLSLPLLSFSSATLDHQFVIGFAVEADSDTARRVQAMLWRIHGIQAVEAFSEDSSVYSATALLRVHYDIARRVDVFKCLDQYGAKVLSERPTLLCVEVVGPCEKIESIHSCLNGYAVVELKSLTLGYINASV